MRKVILGAAASMLGLTALLIVHINSLDSEKYELGREYESFSVSFANECPLNDFSPEKKVIYDRRRTGSSKVCIDRQGALTDIKPLSVAMTRSSYDGSYKVTLRFDDGVSLRITDVFRRGNGRAVIYRDDTLLTRMFGGTKGKGREISVYPVDRDEADMAMDQVAMIASQKAAQSWHR